MLFRSIVPRRAPSRKRVETVGVLGALCTPVSLLVALFCYGSFVELASADKRAGEALPDIPVNGLTDHIVTWRLSRVGYMGSKLHVPLWATEQLTTSVSDDFWNRKRDLVAFYLVKFCRSSHKKHNPSTLSLIHI